MAVNSIDLYLRQFLEIIVHHINSCENLDQGVVYDTKSGEFTILYETFFLGGRARVNSGWEVFKIMC